MKYSLNNNLLNGLFRVFGSSILALGIIFSTEAKQAELTVACGAVGKEYELCKQAAERWAAQTGNQVKIVSTPNDTTEKLNFFQQQLNAQSSDIDVFQIDVIWPSILAGHLVDFKPHMKATEVEAFFPSMISNNTVEGRLVALPWYTDAGLLYYRKDLLEKYNKPVPQTWEELTETAKVIQDGERQTGKKNFWGLVFQGRAYEGLTCNALEWVDAFQGGQILDANGKSSVNNTKAQKALQLAASWVGSIAPQGVLNYAEEEARGVFQSGNAVFMRNWPYAWSEANNNDSPIKGKVGVAPLPKGGSEGKYSGTLGGWQLAVSKYSKNSDLAVDLAKFLASADEQKRRAIDGSFNPTLTSLYDDPDILKKNPFFGELRETFKNAVARPSSTAGAEYNKVSNLFWDAVHKTLSGAQTAEESLKKLDDKLTQIKGKGESKK